MKNTIKSLVNLANKLDESGNHITADFVDTLIKNAQEAKIMYIVRGLPGSGKSTLAKNLAGPDGVIYSTDDFFMEGGEYKFDPKKIVENHMKNQARAKAACESGISPIVIDNTNVQKWETRPYVQMAKDNGYQVKFMESNTPWARDPEELAKRNLHGVPLEGIKNMLTRYEPHDTFTDEEVLKSKAPWEK